MVPRPTASEATSGPVSGSLGSSSRSSGSRTAGARCRDCSSAWDGPRRSPSPAPSSGTRGRSSGGGSPIHRRAEVQEFVAEARGKIHLEPLPAYAPDLNPVEWLWKHLKKVELRNLACLDLEQLHMELPLALGRVRQRRALIRSF